VAFQSQHDVVAYLLNSGLLPARVVADGELEIADASQRNANFKVIVPGGPSYLVKQGVDPERRTTLLREAALYRAFSSRGAQPMRRFTVRSFGYDEREHVLVLELFVDALDFRQAADPGGALSRALASSLGSALATLHCDGPGADCPDDLSAREACWALAIHRPDLGMLGRISAGNMRLLSIIQEADDVGRALEELQAKWTPSAWIHGDIRWANCLRVSPRSGFKLVDWELAGRGDPAWDIGAVLSEHLHAWLHSIPITSRATLSRLAPSSERRLLRSRTSLRHFWSAYARRARIDRHTAADRLRRAAGFAGARLLQAAYEQMQGAIELTPTVIGLLQLGSNVLRRQEESLTELCGFNASVLRS
jgi:Phosphotransferase enzyme family